MAKKKGRLKDMLKKAEENSIENANKSGSSAPKDPRVYKISKDENGGGSILLQFLPHVSKKADQLNTFVTRQSHNFNHIVKGKKTWMDESCISMTGEECPLCEEAWLQYNLEKEENGKESAKKMLKATAKKTYHTNILIKEDKIHPENEGKIFVFKYGKQLFDLINAESNPPADVQEERGIEPFSVYDIYSSREFRLKLTPAEGQGTFPHWKASFFTKTAPSDLSDTLIELAKAQFPDEFDESEMDEEEAIEMVCHDLTEFVDGSDCLSPEDLMKKYHMTMGTKIDESSKPSGTDTIEDDDDDDDEEEAKAVEAAIQRKKLKKKKAEEAKAKAEEVDEEEAPTPKSKKKMAGDDDIDDFLDSL